MQQVEIALHSLKVWHWEGLTLKGNHRYLSDSGQSWLYVAAACSLESGSLLQLQVFCWAESDQ